MGKKGLVPSLSISILLTLPEGAAYQETVGTFLTSQGAKVQPIFFNPEGETVTIGLVREVLRHSSFARATSEQQAIVICALHTATLPAQNALLKLVEEPPINTQLILAAYPGRQLLPTLVSRCREIIWAESTENIPAEPPADDHGKQLMAFLNQPESYSYHEIIQLAEEFKETEVAKKTLRQSLRELTEQGSEPKNHHLLQNLLSALTALENNGNVRLVLEHFLFRIKQTKSGTQ